MRNNKLMSEMPDIQNAIDTRQVDINKVGVKNIKYPIIVKDKKKGHQHTVASINMYVNLPHHFKGTHMSRFIEILNEFKHEKISLKEIQNILREMIRRLHAKAAHFEIEFPYFIEKEAPVSKAAALMEYSCKFVAERNDDKDKFIVSVLVPVTSVCPCSKEISLQGAHNQRSLVAVSVQFNKFIWIEDLIDLIERSASCEVYSLLKRPDEKYVTEKAYDNPMFVEDIVRDISSALIKDDNITWFTVESENFESIHNHSAYAYIER
ncbi:GTP cyclohydrolase FolE2 [Thermodesulfobacteriota bacterium]